MNQQIMKVNSIVEEMNRREDAMEYFVQLFDEGVFTQPVLQEMIDREIGLGYLAHLPLSNDWLWKLYQKNPTLCAEAIYSLLDCFLQDTISIEAFHEFYVECDNEDICDHLYRIILGGTTMSLALYQKFQEAIRIIKSVYLEDSSTYRNAVQCETYLMLLKTTDEEQIANFYAKENPVYDLAISQNVYTPVAVLKDLEDRQGVKFAKVIRNNAARLLKQKNGIR